MTPPIIATTLTGEEVDDTRPWLTAIPGPQSSCRRAPRPCPVQRNRHLQVIAERGRMGWQKSAGYNARAEAEGAMSRDKRIIGNTLQAHSRPAQRVETEIAANVLNLMLDLGRPESIHAV